MSIHPVPSPVGDAEDAIRWQRMSDIKRLCAVYLRAPSDVTDDGTTLALVFTPDLTAPQSAILDRLIALSGLMRITPAEWQAIEPDIAGLVTYQGLANPTLAQTVLAVKAQSRILRAIIRN